MVRAQAEKLQRQAISTLRKGGAGGRALARGYSGLADIVYQSSSRRAPEALQHLRTAVAVRIWVNGQDRVKISLGNQDKGPGQA